MKLTKFNNKIKNTILSLCLAVAMLLSANYSCMYGLVNFTKQSYANAVYSSTNYKNYKFDDSSLYTNTEKGGNSNNYFVSRYSNMIDPQNNIKANKDGFAYFPIAKYNGISTLKSEMEKIENLAEIDKLDNYYGVLATYDYKVVSKSYTKEDGKDVFETTTSNDKEVNYIYVSIPKKSSETTDAYNTRVAIVKNALSEMNNTNQDDVYVYLDTNALFDSSKEESATNKKTNPSYDHLDYSVIGNETEQYKAIGEDITAYNTAAVNESDKLTQSDLNFFYKKDFEYTENSLSLYSSSINLTSNSYYVLSVWVYTAGDATATIAVTDTDNKYINAKIENISTNGLWVQYYLFIESRATDSTNVKINLYYGNQDGVTGNKSLSDYQNGFFTNTSEENYNDKLMSGTVAFDDLKLDNINYTEFVNQTINGHSPSKISNANIAKGYSLVDSNPIKNANKVTVTTDPEDNSKKVYSYNYVNYSNKEQLTNVAVYSAKFAVEKLFENSFDQSFQSLLDATNNTLVYNYNDTTALNYNSYDEELNTNKFTYYMPRYSNGTTYLTLAEKTAYRNRYNYANADYTAEEIAKYGKSQLWATIVEEGKEFEAYDKELKDEFGNNITEKDPEDDSKTINKTEETINNTFITSANGKNNILKLENKSSYALGLTTAAFTIAANAIYKVSVWAYSSNKEAVATAKLFSTAYTKDALELGELIIASAEAKDFKYNDNSFNGWREISFVVKGNPSYDMKANLSLIASAEDTIYFDNIKVENISSTSYDSGANKLDLTKHQILSTNIKNGFFNDIKVESEDPINTYPYIANNWTIDKDVTTESVVSGIISTKDAEYLTKVVPAYNDEGKLDYYDEEDLVYQDDKIYYQSVSAANLLKEGVNYLVDYAGKLVKTTTIQKMFGNQQIPTTTIAGAQFPRTNVYAVNMPKATEGDNPSFAIKSSDIGYSSSNTTLQSNNVYKLTFQVWFGTNFEGTFNAKLIFNKKSIADIEVKVGTSGTLAKQAWHTFTIYVRTGNTSRSSISLQLGATKTEGTMFFQNVNIEALKEITVDGEKLSINQQYDKVLSDNNTVGTQDSNLVRFVDMQNNDFTMHSTAKDEDTLLYESFSYTLPELEKDAKVDYTQGKVNVVNTEIGFNLDSTLITSLENANTDSTTALILLNKKTTDYTVANSTFNTTLSANKYYKTTFDVKTSDLGENGLKVTVNGNGINESFTDINTYSDEAQDNNGWTTYTLYLRVGANSISDYSLSFKLGKDDGNSFTGWALVSNLEINEIEEDVYNTDTEKDEVKNNPNTIVKSLYEEKEEEEKDEEEKDGFNWQTFFLVFSSILLVVSLVIALVSVIVKKKAKKPVDTSNGGIEKTDDTEQTGGIV